MSNFGKRFNCAIGVVNLQIRSFGESFKFYVLPGAQKTDKIFSLHLHPH